MSSPSRVELDETSVASVSDGASSSDASPVWLTLSLSDVVDLVHAIARKRDDSSLQGASTMRRQQHERVEGSLALPKEFSCRANARDLASILNSHLQL